MVETFFTEKRIIKKIVIAIVFIFLFNFTFSYLGNNVVFAEDAEETGSAAIDVREDKELEEGGGKLLLPIHSLVMFIADACMQLLQTSFLTSEPIILEAKSDNKKSAKGIGWVIGGIAITAVAILTWISPVPGDEAVGTSVAAAWWAAGAGTKILTTVALTTTIAGPAMVAYGSAKLYKNLRGKFELPNIWYTPAEIFAGKVPLFDINFFNPSENKYETSREVKYDKISETNRAIGDAGIDDIYAESVDRILKLAGYEEVVSSGNQNIIDKMNNELDYTTLRGAPSYEINGKKYYVFMNLWTGGGPKYMHTEITVYYYDEDSYEVYVYEENHEKEEDARKAFKDWSNSYSGFGSADSESTKLANIKENYKTKLKEKMEILQEKGKNSENVFVEIFEYEGVPLRLSYQYTTSQAVLYLNSGEEKIIGTYESTSKELQSTVASIYKALRTIAIVSLLSILVYVGIRMVLSSASKDKAKYKQMLLDWLVAFIMLFALHYIMAFIIDICESLTGVCSANDIDIISFEIPGNTEIKDPETEEWGYIWGSETDEGYGIWRTSFVGLIRWQASLVQTTGYTVNGVAATLMYVVLVIYIVMFSFQYMKRVLYMAFLTMIAPLVAITYPLDKINDGKAQGFSMWLKEYIFNALLQPIHYIIYVIIMGSVMQLVIEHPVYGLVALGFMIPAEKFIRKMFGFEKASTVGTFGAAAGAAALMGGLQKLRHNPHGKKNDDNGAKGEKDDPNGKVRTISAMPDGPNNPGGGNGGLPGESNNPRPGDPGFIGPLPYDRNSTLLGMPETTDNQSNSNHQAWNSRLSQEQIDELKAEGIAPGDQEYDFALRNYGIKPEEESGWDPRLTPEQIDYAREKDIYEPKGQEYEQFLGELGYGRNSSSSETVTPTPQPRPQPRPTPSPEPTVDLMSYATNRRRVPVQGERRNIFNRSRGTIGQGFKAVAGHYKRRLDNRLRKAHPLRALRRGLTFGAGALTLGTIGLAAGIASGDPSKALQYTVAGGAAGGYLGRNIGETASNIVGLEGATKSFKAGALGDEYDKLERAKYKRDFKNNVSNYDVGVRSVGVDGWKDMSKDGGIIDTGIDYGINNVNDLGNIYKAKEEFKNQYGMNDEEAQDWAFKAYKLDQNFGDWSKNSRTRENLDKLLKAKGYIDDTQREDVTKKMIETMGVYQNVALDKEIEEIKPDYTRISNQNTEETEPTSSQGPMRPNLNLFGHDEVNNNDGYRRENQEDKDLKEDRYNREQQAPITNVQKENTEELARRANAESEANKAAMRQKEENRKIQEGLEARAKADKKAERRAKTEAARQRAAKQKEKNNVRNGEQGSQVRNEVDPDKRTIKPKTKNVNPISSDPGTNGNGPINTL